MGSRDQKPEDVGGLAMWGGVLMLVGAIIFLFSHGAYSSYNLDLSLIVSIILFVVGGCIMAWAWDREEDLNRGIA